MEKQSNTTILSNVWKFIKKDYKILKYIGHGSFGTLVKVLNKKNHK